MWLGWKFGTHENVGSSPLIAFSDTFAGIGMAADTAGNCMERNVRRFWKYQRSYALFQEMVSLRFPVLLSLSLRL